MASTGEVILNYHDCLLRRSDLALLEGPRWLNDQLISFAFEYFEYELFKNHSAEVAFISPDIAQFIKFSEGADLGLFLEPLDLNEKQLVLLAINDNYSESVVGGSHWSLLMFSRKDQTFRHYDSSGSYNEHAARHVARKLQPHVGLEKLDFSFVQEHASQQQNGYDCGLFVICNAELLCKQNFEGSETLLTEGVSQARAAEKRHELKELIIRLSSQGEAE